MEYFVILKLSDLKALIEDIDAVQNSFVAVNISKTRSLFIDIDLKSVEEKELDLYEFDFFVERLIEIIDEFNRKVLLRSRNNWKKSFIAWKSNRKIEEKVFKHKLSIHLHNKDIILTPEQMKQKIKIMVVILQ